MRHFKTFDLDTLIRNIFLFYIKISNNCIKFTLIRNIIPMDSRKIGELIQKRRLQLKLTQKDVAEMTGMTFKSISEIELGIRNPTLNTLNKILEILGLAISVQIKIMN